MDMGLANPLIVTDRGSAQLPFIGALQRALKATGISSDVFAMLRRIQRTPTLRRHGKCIVRAGMMPLLPSAEGAEWMRVRRLP
jgi:alcohol dehydrogenase class IV